MKKISTRILFYLLLLCAFHSAHSQKQLILNTTGYGFSSSAPNGIDADIWTYIQKWVNLTYNGQTAGVTAVRLHIPWNQYEPTLGNYQGAKLAQAVQAIKNLKPGMKVALHFPFQRPGPQPGQTTEGYLTDDEIARIPDGTQVKETITYTIPSIYSQTAKTKFYNFVNDALNAVSPYYNDILYVVMGNGSAEEFVMPIFEKNGYHYPGMYEQAAVQAWRNEYLPCRYPGQTSVTWNGVQYTFTSAPGIFPGQWTPWTTDSAKEYHRFASWGLMKFYKGFRDIVKGKSSSLKVIGFPPGFGTGAGNIQSMHNSKLPMELNELDGIYASEGVDYNDIWRKILALDVLKGTNINKIAGVEFDPADLGQQQNPKVIGVWPNAAREWIERAYKHGADYVHMAMAFDNSEIDQLAEPLAYIRANYVNGTYQSPARQPAVTANIYPNSFGGGPNLFDDAWKNQDGDDYAVTDANPKSVSMTDVGYWENIWSCSGTPPPCDFNITASGGGTFQPNATVNLSSTCSGQCTGVTYAWSGNGISGSNQNISFNAPATPGTYTYTITASKSGCTNKTATAQVVVQNSGGENPCNYVDKQTVGTWNGLSVQTRQYTVNGVSTWLIVTAVTGSSTDKHFPRGKNFADRTDITWNGTFNKTCLGGGNTDWGGLTIPSGITVPSGYVQGTEPDGAVYFQTQAPPPTFSQCLESELQTGNGAVTSDPNASNGQTRGEQNNYNHYVDYAITGVPVAGTYYVTLRYYSSAAPTISVQVGSGTPQTINLANSGSWNIVWTTHQFSVQLQAGNNTLKISGTGGGSCRQDRICVSHTSGSPVMLEPEVFGESQVKQFSVSPNPSRGVFETQFYLERGKKASIIINDLQGRVIFNKQVIGNGGLHKERINLNNKASGMLLMQLKTDKGVELKKINIAR